MIIPISPATRLPSSILVVIERRFLTPPMNTTMAISSSSVYRSVSTDRQGVLLPFVIYAALSSGPRQHSYGRPRPFGSIRRLYIHSFSSWWLHFYLHKDRYLQESSNSRESVPCAWPGGASSSFLRLLRAPFDLGWRCHRVAERRCDRPGRSLISHLWCLS